MNLKVKRLHDKALIPQYQTAGAACFDLHAVVDTGIAGASDPRIVVEQEYPAVIRTGLSFEVPEGHVMMIYSRSGHGFKNDIRLANCVGVIDSDYRGEVMVKLRCDSDMSFMNIRSGDRIAQAMVVPVNQIQFEEVDALSETDRGERGYGSTGA